jgi:hypothetical protein
VSGIVVFQIVVRKMPLTMSAAPASVSARRARARFGAKPSAVIATPQPAAAQQTASPCRWMCRVQPLVAVARSAPTDGAA